MAQFLAYVNGSAGYFFADHGYDVWLGNPRGIYLNPNHTTLDPNSAEYWDFSIEQLGELNISKFSYSMQLSMVFIQNVILSHS